MKLLKSLKMGKFFGEKKMKNSNGYNLPKIVSIKNLIRIKF